MKKNLFIAALAFGTAAMAQAQTQTAASQPPAGAPAPAPAAAPGPTPTKVAVINFQAAVTNTEEGKQAFGALQTKFQPKKTEFERRQNEIQQLQDQLKKGSGTMSDEQRSKIERDIDAKTKAYQRDTQDANDDMEQEGNKIYQELGQKMYKIVGDYAGQNGYVAVIDTSSQQSPVIWVAPSNDITAEMIRLYNQAHPLGSAPAAKPSAPAVKPPAAPPAIKK